ncbi:17673_t:CDS:2, partial [Racocetra fulgida]
MDQDPSPASETDNAISPTPSAVIFTVLCTASIALVITAAALFFVANKRMKKDESLESYKVESGLLDRDSDIILKEGLSKESLPISAPPMLKTDQKVKPSTPPSTGSATPQTLPHFPQLNTQLFDSLPDSYNIPPKAYKSGIISRSRSSIDLAHLKDKEKEPFTESTLYNDSPGPPLGSDSVPSVPKIDPEQPGESQSLYMTSHHPSADFLQEMPSPMRHEYTTSPVRSPRTSGDVRPQSRQSSEYMVQSSQELSDPQLRTTHMEPDILHESLGDPYLEYTTRSDRSERSRSRGSRDDSVGMPLAPQVSRRARSSRRSTRDRRSGGNGYSETFRVKIEKFRNTTSCTPPVLR